jgi:DNA gyrase/topoisomerase IV subunit A
MDARLQGVLGREDHSEISDFNEGRTDTTLHFTVIATKAKVDEFEKAKGGLLGKFKLSATISTNNMTLFDENGKIHKYKTALDILKMFHHHRLGFYVKRKVWSQFAAVQSSITSIPHLHMLRLASQEDGR